MSKLEAVPVTGIEVIPVKGGSAVFLVTALKTMFIQVDPAVGEALQGALDGRIPDRPDWNDRLIADVCYGNASQYFGFKA